MDLKQLTEFKCAEKREDHVKQVKSIISRGNRPASMWNFIVNHLIMREENIQKSYFIVTLMMSIYKYFC